MGYHYFAIITASFTFLLIVVGALVTGNDAGLSVPDWPLSYGSLNPPWVGNIRYEHGHRLVAAFVGFLTVVLAVWIWKKRFSSSCSKIGNSLIGCCYYSRYLRWSHSTLVFASVNFNSSCLFSPDFFLFDRKFGLAFCTRKKI